MKALKILKKYGHLINQYTMDLVSKDIHEAIKELEAIQDIMLEKDEALEIERLLHKQKIEDLDNRSCDGCKHLPTKKRHLEYECLIEVCRSCKRNGNDNWEQN
jgi:hypothetical protein